MRSLPYRVTWSRYAGAMSMYWNVSSGFGWSLDRSLAFAGLPSPAYDRRWEA